jgi:prepilin-type N-terminal cleavage/methylation domain-containing protein
MLKKKPNSGFTIIEVVIVLAIVGLIMVIVFIAVPEAQMSVRDSHRRAYAQTVLQAMEEYYKNNGQFPGCAASCSSADAIRFMTHYLPNGNDPSTGQQYNETDPTRLVTSGSGAIATPSHSFIYTYSGNDVEHYVYPATGQVLLGMNHWCYATTGYDPAGNGPTNGPPLAGINGDNADDKFAILIYQERGGFYCLDNYAKH